MFAPHGLQRIAARQFGRRQPFTFAMPVSDRFGQSFGDDARLFMTTFAGGLLFMTVYLA
jgi:hypothetical protein